MVAEVNREGILVQLVDLEIGEDVINACAVNGSWLLFAVVV